MWEEVKQARYKALRAADRQGVLTEVEGIELRALTQELDVLALPYLDAALSPRSPQVVYDAEILMPPVFLLCMLIS